MATRYHKKYEDFYKHANDKALEFYKLFLLSFVLVSISILLFFYMFSILSFLFPKPPDNIPLIFLGYVMLGLTPLVIGIWLIRKSTDIRPTWREWSIIHYYKFFKNLEYFYATPLNSYLRKAMRNARKTGNDVFYWNIGNLKCIQNLVEDDFFAFQDEFSRKIRSIVKRGSKDEKLELIKFSNQFIHFLTFGKEEIDEFNGVIKYFKDLQYKPISLAIKKSFFNVILTKINFFCKKFKAIIKFIEKYKILKHIFVVGGIIFGAYIIFIICINFTLIDKGAIFQAVFYSATMFILFYFILVYMQKGNQTNIISICLKILKSTFYHFHQKAY